ncbi:MAG: Ldh family oxidoreductase [Bryobacteraceae bacterium]
MRKWDAIMSEPHVVVDPVLLRDFSARMMEAAGASVHAARLVADSLVAANLRGVDSHGVQLLPPYVERLQRGDIDAHATGRVVSENGACLVYDAANAIGQTVSGICCDHAVRLARSHGAGVVVARESNHFGAAAYWAQRISDAGMIGIVLCNASPLVAPWQGKDRRLGTNPICMSAPGDRLWLLDMATTTVALNKVFKAAATGQETIPAGWAMDANGNPTTGTAAAIAGSPLPLGGYKGSGLAMMVEILCAVLSGGAISTELGGLRLEGRPMRVSQFFLALDVARFMPVAEFTARMEHLRKTVKSSAPAPGYDEVLLAGDPEWRIETERARDGIPIQPAIWKSLSDVAEKLNIPVPAQRSESASEPGCPLGT